MALVEAQRRLANNKAGVAGAPLWSGLPTPTSNRAAESTAKPVNFKPAAPAALPPAGARFAPPAPPAFSAPDSPKSDGTAPFENMVR